MNGVWGAQYTLGVQQGEDAAYLKTIVTLKQCVRARGHCALLQHAIPHLAVSTPPPAHSPPLTPLSWDAYSLENSDGYTRHNFDAKVSDYALQHTYFPAFRASVVEGGAQGVMCSCAWR